MKKIEIEILKACKRAKAKRLKLEGSEFGIKRKEVKGRAMWGSSGDSVCPLGACLLGKSAKGDIRDDIEKCLGVNDTWINGFMAAIDSETNELAMVRHVDNKYRHGYTVGKSVKETYNIPSGNWSEG